MLKIAHMLNLFSPSPSSDLAYAIPITLESMRRAKQFASEDVDVSFYSSQYAGDHDSVPSDFMKTPDLDRSIADVQTFDIHRTFPLFKDILDRFFSATEEADYLVYTNADIALQPHFYEAISKIIELGYDAFAINRRTIPDIELYHSIESLPLMYSELGLQTAGYDCFVYKRENYKHYNVEGVCIGIPFIGRALMANMMYYSKKFRIFENPHLTFHIGDDGDWKNSKYDDYLIYNIHEYTKIIKRIEKDFGELDPKTRAFLMIGSENRQWVNTAEGEVVLSNLRPQYESLRLRNRPIYLKIYHKLKRLLGYNQ